MRAKEAICIFSYRFLLNGWWTNVVLKCSYWNTEFWSYSESFHWSLAIMLLSWQHLTTRLLSWFVLRLWSLCPLKSPPATFNLVIWSVRFSKIVNIADVSRILNLEWKFSGCVIKSRWFHIIQVLDRLFLTSLWCEQQILLSVCWIAKVSHTEHPQQPFLLA